MECQFKKIVLDKENPFLVNGVLKVGLKATGQKVFVWPDPKPTKIGSFWLPENIKDREKLRLGIVLTVGPGYFDNKKKRFIPTEVKPGQRVLFDNTTPWPIILKDPKGNEQTVRVMTELDIKGIINCEDCQECNF